MDGTSVGEILGDGVGKEESSLVGETDGLPVG